MQNTNGSDRKSFPMNFLFNQKQVTFSAAALDEQNYADANVNIFTYAGTDKHIYSFYGPDSGPVYREKTIDLTNSYCALMNTSNSLATFTEKINKYAIQVELGSKGSGYEPYTGTTIPVDWTSEAGTLYGGYVDLITGELVQTHYSMYINRNTITTMALDKTNETYTQAYFINSTNNIPKFKSYTGLSNRFKCLKNSTAVVNGFINFGGNSYFMLPSSELATKDVAGMLDWFDTNPTFYVAELYTPITHQLSPTQLSTLIGRNNIWSNADRVEVEYDLAESNDELYKRRNILLRSMPHIETASGNIINF